MLPGYLRQTFAKYLAPGDRSAGVLVARIDDVTLGAPQTRHVDRLPLGQRYAPTASKAPAWCSTGAAGWSQSYPLFSSVGADSLPNSPYQTDIRRRRAETLALSFAQWLPGKMGL